MFTRIRQTIDKTLSKEPPCFTYPEPPTDGTVRSLKLDFPSLGLPEYRERTAIVIDGVFDEKDCERIMEVAGGENAKWEVAQVNGGPGTAGVTVADYRNSERIIVDDEKCTEWMMEKLDPYLDDIRLLDHCERHHRCAKWKGGKPFSTELEDKPRAKLVRINERLRFLRYGPGQFFKRHCDGLYYTPDRSQASYYTIQIYINGSPSTLKGGATRFYSIKDTWERDERQGPCVDIPPRVGRVLVFEQDRLLHSGESVESGMKISVRTEFMYEAVADPDDQADGAGAGAD